ncbi:MAG: DUF1800 family protein, partial [Gaiellaceae bacterium]
DSGTKTVFGRSGAFGWQDACRLCVENPAHAGFLVRKLWSAFVPKPPPAATQAALGAAYRQTPEIRPLVEAILRHPDLYGTARMVKPPVVYTAGLLRALGRPLDSIVWTKLDAASGQRLFYPPNVAGWDDTRWLDTATFRGRWFVAATALASLRHDEKSPSASIPSKPQELVNRTIALLGGPLVSAKTRHALHSFAGRALVDAKPLGHAPAIVENALRQLLATSPDLQTS